MADIAFDLIDSTARVAGVIRYTISGNTITFQALMSAGYAAASHNSSMGYYFDGNNAEYMRLLVDGSATDGVLTVLTHHYGDPANRSGWIQDNTYNGAATSSVSRTASQTTTYSVTVEIYGNGGASKTASVTLEITPPTPTIPIVYAKVGGTWKRVSTMYAKVNGVWKTVNDFYSKVNGTWRASAKST